jgi:hypothetical protein
MFFFLYIWKCKIWIFTDYSKNVGGNVKDESADNGRERDFPGKCETTDGEDGLG